MRCWKNGNPGFKVYFSDAIEYFFSSLKTFCFHLSYWNVYRSILEEKKMVKGSSKLFSAPSLLAKAFLGVA